MQHDQTDVDCLVIGGGPAGLTAAIYLARFHREVVVIDAGKSRALLIPEGHNYPGFAAGVGGPKLIALLREQAQKYGARLQTGTVESLARDGDMFTVVADGAGIRARTVLLATGIVDTSPPLPGLDDAIYDGVLRYCPICDAFEATDQRIAVIGSAKAAWEKSLFLRGFSRDVTLLATDDIASLDDDCVRELKAADVRLPPAPVESLKRNGETITATLTGGGSVEFDVLYPALGCDVRSDLATKLGVPSDNVGCLHVDDKQRTCVDNLYAAGDVVTDLHQLSVATGHAAIAATAIHKALGRSFR